MNGHIRVRIKATGQVIDMVPSAAWPMINGGTAERVKQSPIESMATEPSGERAVAAAQAGPVKKLLKRR